MTGARLHPRLVRRFAQQLFDEQAGLSLDELRDLAEVSHPLEIWPAVGAERVSRPELAALRDAVRQIADDHGWPAPPSREAASSFDRQLSRLLLGTRHLFPAEAAILEMWSFLALVLLPDVVGWRAHDSTNRERWVGVDLTRHTLAKQYWRAYAFTRDAEDTEEPWELFDSLGEADFDQIQTRRSAYGVNPRLSRAVARSYLRLRDQAGDRSRRDVWRDFLKRVAGVGAFVSFAALDRSELERQFRQFEQEVLAAPHGNGDRPVAGEGDGPARPEAGTSFDVVPLRDIVVLLTEAIERSGTITERDLSHVFEQGTGITIPSGRRSILRGIAWQGNALGYLRHDSDDDTFGIGATHAAPDRRWGDWTIADFLAHARETEPSDPDALSTTLFQGKANRTVRRIVRLAGG
jgi:hypothetical protein